MSIKPSTNQNLSVAATRTEPQASTSGGNARVGDGRGGLDAPPSTNRGGNEKNAELGQQFTSVVLTEKGELKEVMVRKPSSGQACFIDTLRFTFGEQTLLKTSGLELITDLDFIKEASFQLSRIFGFGITRDLQRMRDFYSNAWELGENYGYVAFGGLSQRNTMLVVLNGDGCLAAKDGWEHRLYEFLESSVVGTITRVDLAHDCFDGSYLTVDKASDWYDEGLFSLGYRPPEYETRGNWKNPNGKGRTLYVGLRRNGKLCRVYEKGKQLGDPTSDWTRIEVELRNTGRIVPNGVLLDPSAYFAGCYPCTGEIAKEITPVRIKVKTKKAKISVGACIENIKRSYGKAVKALRSIYGDEEFLNLVESVSDELPRRLLIPDFRFCSAPVHLRKPFSYMSDAFGCVVTAH
ncbi:replication initiation factor domain-containing protein [Alcaligenes nematophilus]|uniref:replication initiation factor domain-containing protein n=1 Tax=Alcaligenes nematophilus TaxID=2994643 RepID=UPI0034E092A0